MVNGSIRIKTRLDNSQAKKDAKEFEKVVDDAAENAKNSGEKAAVNIDVSQAEKEIKRLEKDIEKYQKKLDQLNNGKFGEFNAQKIEIQALTDKDLRHAATDEQAAHVLEMEKVTLEQLESKYKSVVAEAREYTSQIEQAKQRQSELKSQINQAENAQRQANSEQRKSTNAASKTATKASNLKDMIRSAKNAAGAFAKNLGVKAYNGAVKTGSVIKNTFVKGLKKSLAHIKSMRRSTDHLRKNFLRMGLGLVGMESLISGFRQIVSSALNDNEKLQNQLTAIKGILGMGFTPLINAIVNSLTQVVSLVDKVYAAFTGTSLIARYNAEQAKKIADSTSDAADSAKEYNNQLAGFDVANKLTDNRSSSNNSPNDTSITFDADYSASVAKFADMIKKSWEKADFTDVGNTISKKLVTMLQGLNWNNIKSKGFGTGKSFATLLNGLFSYSDKDGNTLATSIGETIGESFNTLVSLAMGFAKNLNWKNTGKELAKGLLKAINTIDWGDTGETVHDFVVGLCDSIAAFFDELSKDDEGYKTIKKAVTDFFNGLELCDIVFGIVDPLISISHFTFDILGNLLDDIIESLCEKFGWEWDGKWMQMKGPLGIMVPKIKFKVDSKKSDADKEDEDDLSWWERLNEFLGKTSPITMALGTGIGEATVNTTITGNISDSFKELKLKWDSISEKGKTSLSTIKGSIQSNFNTLKSKWDSIKNKTNTSSIKGSIQKTFNTLKSKWDSIRNKANTSTIKGSIAKSFSNAKNNWNSIKNKAVTVTASLKDGITNGIRNILNSLCNMVNKVIGVLNKIPGVNISKISPPKLARGGIVNNPGRGVTVTAGEAGPEAVLPLNDSVMSKLGAMIGENLKSAAGQIIVPIYFDSKKIMTYVVDAQNKQAFAMNKGGAY